MIMETPKMEHTHKILVINPGSTSTKLAYYEDNVCILEKNIDVEAEKIKGFQEIFDQYPLRLKQVEDFVAELGMEISDFDIIAARGGGGGHLKSGGYAINQALVDHCRAYEIPHASSLAACIAYEFMQKYGIAGYIYDAEGVDEFNEYAKLSGWKEFPISPGGHILNAKAAARKYAEISGKAYEDLKIVVCHMGGGCNTTAHDHGRIIDSTSDAFAPERAGNMPMMGMINFIRQCFSGKYSCDEVIKMCMGRGGLVGYLGTSDMREVERRIESGDKEAALCFNAMVYWLCKDIAAMSSTMDFHIDGIVLTGGLAKSKRVVEALSRKIQKLGPVCVLPGALEMEALASGALRCYLGQEVTHLYGE